MKRFQKLERFPLGSIRAEGFLKDQMLLGKDGITGNLYKIEPDMIANPYVNKTPVAAWAGGDQDGWGAELSGNYWTGYIEAAFTLDDPEMKQIAENWVNGTLKNQQPDGYLGTYTGENAKIYDDFNGWGTSCGMRALIVYYEATGRKDVLDAVHRCMLWFCDKWAGDRKTAFSGIFLIEPMVFTYYHTGDERLIQFAEDYMDFICRNDITKTSYKEMLSDRFFYHAYHAASIGGKGRLPAVLYTATGNEDYLRASEKFIAKNRAKSIQITGAPVSSTEFNGPVGATQESEYCGFTLTTQAYSYLSYITGKAEYGDYMEEVFYNAAQGARKKDERAICYLSAPNQIYASELSSRVYGDQQVYAPCYPTACCPVNSVVIVPEFIRGMMLRDKDDNVYVTAYGPCTLDYKDISIAEDTLYPFRNSVKFTVNCDKKFTFNLKNPVWSDGFKLKINGEVINAKANENGYIAIDREWKCGDIVEISFETEVKVIKIDDSDCNSKFPIAIKYGALVYSYHIPENWKPIKGRPMTQLPEGWSWYNVLPVYKEADLEDAHERIVMRKKMYSWNVAVDENLTAKDFEIEEIEPNGYIWSNPAIRLHTHCYKAPYINAPYENKTFDPYCEYQYVEEKLPLVLEPYGCTNLRITFFPKADLNNRTID